MRNWFKAIIFECLREIIKDQPLILGSREPCEDDVYSVGTHWISGNRKWVCSQVKAEWREIK